MKWTNVKIMLLDRQFKRLSEEKERTGSSIAELIRRAVDNTYPEPEKTVKGKL
jgi:Ribbon-helix-helix protein, copG family